MSLIKNKETSNKELNVIREKWNTISEDFNKQIEKSCYTGVAIICIFLVIGDFNYNCKIIYSLICFIIPLIISFSFNLYELFNNYFIYSRSFRKIQKGAILYNVDLNPSKFGLLISSIYFTLVLIGYLFIGAYGWTTFFINSFK